MRAVVQRVSSAEVSVNGEIVGSIGQGLVVLLAVESNDGPDDVAFMQRKLTTLRLFDDSEGKMNRSVRDVSGAILLISQFTLYGDCRKGTRPSFSRAAEPVPAQEFYERLASGIRGEGIRLETGCFQARMKVSLVNEGPVTLIVDSKKRLY
jgi:D-tyrosyl-tRNA(Tyr) deacylase